MAGSHPESYRVLALACPCLLLFAPACSCLLLPAPACSCLLSLALACSCLLLLAMTSAFRFIARPGLQASPLPPTPMQYWVQLGRFPKCARDSLGRIANGLVRGTRVAFPADGPDSKYAALFDARPEFDDLRLAFLVFSDPQSKVNGLSVISHWGKAYHM